MSSRLFLVGPRGARAGLRRLVGDRRLRGRRRRSGSRPASTPTSCGRRSRRSSPSWPGCATSRSRPTSSPRPSVPVGRPRAADGRHPPRRVVDRRPGGAPRPRPDPRRGARGGRGGERRRRPPVAPRAVPRRRTCGWRSVAPRASPAWARPRGCGCPADRCTTPRSTPADAAATHGRPGSDLVLRRASTCELGSLGAGPGRARDARRGGRAGRAGRCSTSPRSAGGPAT